MLARLCHAGMNGIPEQAQFWVGGPIENPTNGSCRDICDRI